MLALLAGIAIMAQDLPRATTKGAVRLFGDKDDLTSVLTLIPDGSTVEVVTADSIYTRILFDGLDGFVRSDRLAAKIWLGRTAASSPSGPSTTSSRPPSAVTKR